jgi:hypothetical protein
LCYVDALLSAKKSKLLGMLANEDGGNMVETRNQLGNEVVDVSRKFI